MLVNITFVKDDQSELTLSYRPFNNEHSRLWVKSIQAFIKSGIPLDDVDRVYNFSDPDTERFALLKQCNETIKRLRDDYKISMPLIRPDNLQEDVNYVHTYFVDHNLSDDKDQLWFYLNNYLHGLEIIDRRQKQFQGQVFCRLPMAPRYELPDESYNSFTTQKRFGYCYANYPHVGRHIFEVYNARDEEAPDHHVRPMHQIAGGFYLWFGSDTSQSYDQRRRADIERWFSESNMENIVGRPWGDPKLAIGWLPVALINETPYTEDLIGLTKIKNIYIGE